ncbi:hypothetical protein FOCC_FOCC003543 [Frankliniella occidentalis]|nr:hypothetical protein FOCC_FOCC003543 [Frankliniella occidentalis]
MAARVGVVVGACSWSLHAAPRYATPRHATRARHCNANGTGAAGAASRLCSGRLSELLAARYVITELLQSDLHKIIVSPQHLSADHIKVFLYQILRVLELGPDPTPGHQAWKPPREQQLRAQGKCPLPSRSRERDNACVLCVFICDFGLARVEEPDTMKHMTQEVVTQYYRAPEILMGARHYSSAVDAQNPVQQLELITELLGTPSLEDMRYACDGARSHMMRRPHKPPSLSALYMLSSQATHEAVHLLCQMLC